jgi:acyl-CoA reductase-like NAD-dependent aldehyde dehydrogenase
VKSINPHQPSVIIGEFEETGHGGVEEAVARAREAFLEWSEQPAVNRGAALAQMADERRKSGLKSWLSLSSGRSVSPSVRPAPSCREPWRSCAIMLNLS